MRIFLAFLVAALALGGALALHRYEETYEVTHEVPINHPPVREGTLPPSYVPGRSGPTREETFTQKRHPAWADPIAVVVAIAGVGAGAGIAFSRRRGVSP